MYFGAEEDNQSDRQTTRCRVDNLRCCELYVDTRSWTLEKNCSWLQRSDVRGEGEGEEEIWLTCTLAKLTHVLEPTRSQGRQGKHCSSCSRAQGVACSLHVSLSYRTWGSHAQESTRYLICWCCHCSGLQDVNVELTCHSARSINVVYWNCLDWMQVIEKRRRDRINNSLAELRRLVPAAFEKQVTMSRGQQ